MTEIPIPAEVIEYINSLSEGEGKARLPKNPNFEVGGRIINDIEGNDHRANETDELPGNNLEGRVIDRNLAYQQGDVPVNEIVARYDTEDSESDNEEGESVTGEAISEDNETVVEEQVNVPENNCDVNVKTDEAEEDLENQESENNYSLRRGNRKAPGQYKMLSNPDARLQGKALHAKTKRELKNLVKTKVIEHQEKAAEFVFNVTVRQGLLTYGSEAVRSIKKELNDIISKSTWVPVKLSKRELIQIAKKLIRKCS